MGVKEVDGSTFITAYAAHLKKIGKIEVPHFSDYAKTATFKELAPHDPNWWYVRIAAIARQVYLRQGLGVGRLREIYGGSRTNGSRPNHHARASGNVIRKCLQQLETLGLLEKL